MSSSTVPKSYSISAMTARSKRLPKISSSADTVTPYIVGLNRLRFLGLKSDLHSSFFVETLQHFICIYLYSSLPYFIRIPLKKTFLSDTELKGKDQMHRKKHLYYRYSLCLFLYIVAVLCDKWDFILFGITLYNISKCRRSNKITLKTLGMLW